MKTLLLPLFILLTSSAFAQYEIIQYTVSDFYLFFEEDDSVNLNSDGATGMMEWVTEGNYITLIPDLDQENFYEVYGYKELATDSFEFVSFVEMNGEWQQMEGEDNIVTVEKKESGHHVFTFPWKDSGERNMVVWCELD